MDLIGGQGVQLAAQGKDQGLQGVLVLVLISG